MKTLLKATILCLLSCSALSTAVFAQDTFRDKYFVVSGYFYDPDDIRGTDREGGGADVAFGIQLGGPIYAEVRAFGAVYENGVGGGADAYNGGVGADLQYLFGERGEFSAFVLGGVGFAYNDSTSPSPDEGGLQLNGGVGLLSRGLTSVNMRIRMEARAIYEDYLDGVNDYRLGVGLEIPVDAAELVVREVPVAQQVEAAPPQTGAYPPRPVDTDNDSVLDNFDVCPGTLPGTRVDRSGCALPAQNVTMQGVHFEMAEDLLKPNSLIILDQAVRALKGQPGMKVRIAGHTDSIGNARYNEELSMRRARAVKQYLVSQGVNPARLSVIGYGEAQPIASNESKAGQAKNRRVEFEIQGNDPK